MHTMISCPFCFALLLQQEDDVAKIAAKLPYIPALNGNSIATATLLDNYTSGATTVGNATGVVTSASIAEFFQFTANAGTATISGQVNHAVQVGVFEVT
jgi:hypothetical protein